MTTIILCGGAGTRLWPLSRQAFPKQFCDLLGGPSLFERTVSRNAYHSRRFLVVTNRAHRAVAEKQFKSAASGIVEAGFILEPKGRNTAPAIALACLELPPEEIVMVVPSDHVIRDEVAYRRAVESASRAAGEGLLVTFGLRPEHPETGYGYIEARGETVRKAGSPSDGGFAGAALPVASFREKPDRSTAEGYVASGRHFWNSGMFCFKAGRYLEELAESAPEMLEACRKAREGASRQGGSRGSIVEIGEESMAAIPADSIDYAVMEKSERVAVVPCDIGWSDLGSWESIQAARNKDEAGNAFDTAEEAKAVAVDSRGNLVIAPGKTVALVGVEDLVVVETADSLMIAKRERSQDVKKIVEELKARGRTELL